MPEINVVCRTNLDLTGEKWPIKMPVVPRVGDEIQSATTHGRFNLTLQVISVRWQPTFPYDNDYEVYWKPHIELHLTEWQKRLPSKSGKGETGSIISFYEWYAPLVGRSVHSFIG